MTSLGKVILETDRLLLRRQMLTDLDDLWAIYQDPEVVRHIPDRSITREETQQEILWHMNGHPRHLELGLWATIYKP
jgi:ribosomal-protein-alanine N-acetyltransferase